MKRTGGIGLAGLFLVGLVVSMFGCTNVDQTFVPPTNYTSNVMFVDLANTGTDMSVMYDSTTVPSLSYGNHTSSYVVVPAGSRRMRFTYGSSVDTLHQSFTSEYQFTYFGVFEPQNGDASRTYVLAGQSYTSTAAGAKDSALVRFFNLSSDTVASFASGLDFALGTGASAQSASGVAYPRFTEYMQVPAGNSSYSVFADESGDTLVNNAALSGLQSQGRYSVVIYGNHANLKQLVLQEH